MVVVVVVVAVDDMRRREEGVTSLQRSNFFIAVSLPVIVPHLFLFGGAMSVVVIAELALVVFYTGACVRTSVRAALAVVVCGMNLPAKSVCILAGHVVVHHITDRFPDSSRGDTACGWRTKQFLLVA